MSGPARPVEFGVLPPDSEHCEYCEKPSAFRASGIQNVGFLVGIVGSMAGFREEPDIGSVSRISRLGGKCREWQVFLGWERCHEF